MQRGQMTRQQFATMRITHDFQVGVPADTQSVSGNYPVEVDLHKAGDDIAIPGFGQPDIGSRAAASSCRRLQRFYQI